MSWYLTRKQAKQSLRGDSPNFKYVGANFRCNFACSLSNSVSNVVCGILWEFNIHFYPCSYGLKIPGKYISWGLMLSFEVRRQEEWNVIVRTNLWNCQFLWLGKLSYIFVRKKSEFWKPLAVASMKMDYAAEV